MKGYNVYRADWSPDGTKIVYAKFLNAQGGVRLLQGRSELWQIDINNGQTLLFQSPDGQDGDEFFSSPKWSPDGQKIVFGREIVVGSGKGDRNFQLHSLTLMDNELQDLQITSDGGTPAWSPDGKFLAFTQSTVNLEAGTTFSKLKIIQISP